MEGTVWSPSREQIAASNITRFLKLAGVSTFEDLQARAAADPAWFWDLVIKDLGVDFYQPYTQTLDLSRGAPWATWFRGGRMNLANDCVDKWVNGRAAGTGREGLSDPADHADQPAVIYEGEEGLVRRWTYRELQAEANRLAHGLGSLGIAKGDRVGLFLPMIPEIVAAIMALAKVGAVFVPIFSGFAPQAAASRLNDCGARLLITADGFYRRGKVVDMKAVADEACALAPSVEKVVVVRRLGPAGPATPPTPWTPGRDIWYHDLVAGRPADFETARLDPEDPFMIIYTSGTTGRPKGAVHAHCGFPLKAAQDISHCFDLKENELMMWFTDIGWMMGPWLIFGTLALGSACFLYDGAPDWPDPGRIWSMVQRHRITHLGLSPTLIRALMPHGTEWPARYDLSSLRMFGSTGEPWNPDPYMWLFEKVGGGRAPIINYSGGTEVSGGILGCIPIRPLKACSFNCAVPGMAVDVLDEAGHPVRGQVGELVIRGPWAGMTRGFWQDPDRYVDAYWSRWDGVWVHGDWALVDDDDFWYILGRSDDTIKIAGKRVGPAEFESVLVGHPAVAEAAAIGVPHEIKGEVAVCFAVLKPGMEGTEELRQELKQRIVAAMGKPLAPEDVRFTAAVPKTRNAKIMRRVIRAAYLGKSPGDVTALENPDAIEEIRRAR